MDYTETTCRDFIAALASKAPVPGGGGACALVGAVGMALGNMVASLTLGKAKYADVQDDIVRIAARADALQQALLALVAQDAEAFAPLAAAYGLPTETEAERAAKAAVMEAALKIACAVPLTIMERCCEVAELVSELSQIGSAIAVSDAGCGAACCRAALTGGALNVFVNTRLMTDRAYAEDVERRADAMLQKYVPVCDEVYASVARRFRR